ncbi:MAG: hypothetical protein ND895_22690 [Pyrinomonadaceae bacterium]|nr:hypothetical protein [Pyrinomonadaceae bacterium]
MPKVKLSLSVDDQHLSKFSEVVKEVEKAGLTVDEKHRDIGVVNGSIEKDKIDSLRNVEGIEHIEEEREIRIPPPESDIQ